MAASAVLLLLVLLRLTGVHYCKPAVIGCELPSHPSGGYFAVLRDEFEGETKEEGRALPGDMLEFQCNAEYRLEGSSQIPCLKSGNWETKFPKCYRRLCPKLPEVDGGTWSSRLRGDNRMVRMTCNDGHVLQHPKVDHVVCARVNETELEWTGGTPSCRKLAQCPDPGTPANGSGLRSPQDGPYYEGDSLEYECSEGYELVGQDTVLCGKDGAWNHPRARCKPHLTCGELPPEPNGVHVVLPIPRTADYYVPGDRVDLQCNQGYSQDYSDNSDMVFCLEDGTWDSNMTTCIETECDAPRAPKAGYIVEEDLRETYKYNVEIRIRCRHGYRLFGYNWNKCTDDGWLHHFPKCTEVTCREPVAPEYGLRKGASSPFRVNSTVAFACFDGYILTGSSSRTCMDNGQWDGNLAVCTLKTSDGCPNPGQPMDGIRIGTQFRIGDEVHFKCNPGFDLLGSTHRTCQSNGQWDGVETRCRGPRDVDRDQDVKVKLWNELDSELALLDSSRGSSEDGHLRAMSARFLDLSIRDAGGHLVFYFVFDSSGSVGESNFQTSIKFAKALVNRVGLSDNVHVGVVNFGKTARRELFPLGNTKDHVMSTLTNIKPIGGGTATNDALEEVRRMVASVGHQLHNIKTVVFLLTDGLHNVGGNPEEKAAQLKATGAEIFIIGLQGHREINTKSIKRISSSDEHIFYVQGFETLEFLIDQMLTDNVDYSRCGISVRNGSDSDQKGRLIGGVNADIYWPWMAHLNIKRSTDNMCGGSIVDNYWIMTAAHCLKSDTHPNNITVTVGLLRLDGIGEKDRQVRAVDRILIHPNYTARIFDYDVALLRLKTPLVYGKVVRRICLPPDFHEITSASFLYRKQEPATVIGFGMSRDSPTSNDLKEVKVRLQTRETCLNSIRGQEATMTDHMICAGVKEGGKDACHGDSGGPLMQELYPSQTFEEPYWVQVGVVSWGIKGQCGQRGSYGFYTHVAKVKHWIMNTILSQ